MSACVSATEQTGGWIAVDGFHALWVRAHGIEEWLDGEQYESETKYFEVLELEYFHGDRLATKIALSRCCTALGDVVQQVSFTSHWGFCDWSPYHGA